MASKMLTAAIVLGLLVLVSACNAANLSNNTNSTTLLNNTVNATNSTNSTVNLTNISLNMTNSTLKSPIVDSKAKKTDLWTWGDVPKGYARGADNSIIPEAYLDAQGSVMETPSQAVSNNNAANQGKGLLVRPT